MASNDYTKLLADAEAGIAGYLNEALRAGTLNQQLYDSASKSTVPNLRDWLTDPNIEAISPNVKPGIASAIEAQNWDGLVNAFQRKLRFGTGGIRGMMGFDRASIVRLKEEGIDAPILKGPNTLNNVVLLRTSAGVAKYGRSRNPAFDRIVIGYDSRVRGGDFGRAIAELFLAYGFTVYLFDQPCPYPVVTFSIPHRLIKAQLGVLISASHNDYRYNGFKLSCGNGSQFDPQDRDVMYNEFIEPATTDDIRLCPLKDAPEGKLYFLGGAIGVPGFDYAGREDCRIDILAEHRTHVKQFLVYKNLAEDQARASDPLRVGYCAFHGAGRDVVPAMLKDAGIEHIKPVTRNGLNDLDGLFPSFCSDPGKEQQPDPGDPRAAATAIQAFKEEYPGEFDTTDILIGTDPDADRCGVVVKIPEDQRHLYDGQDSLLMPADDMWALLVWYRLQSELDGDGKVRDADRKFIVQSATTTDSIIRVARKYGLGTIRTWVGFASLANAVRDVWTGETLPALVDGRRNPDDPLCHHAICEHEGMDNGKRSFNYAAMEQSNGFSILGDPPPDAFSLGKGGHVRDKDGTFAALLIAEIAAYAKKNGTTLFEMVDRNIYLDPDVGLFVNRYEPDPLDGEYPGIMGDRKKMAILRKALDLYEQAQSGDLEIAGLPVTSTCIYRTGKYDAIYPPSEDFVFPDEGVRFNFSDDGLSYLIVRPSGTGNSLRFHVQLQSPVTQADLIDKKGALRARAKAIIDHLREVVGAPR
jgi:phosphoglucomutase